MPNGFRSLVEHGREPIDWRLPWSAMLANISGIRRSGRDSDAISRRRLHPDLNVFERARTRQICKTCRACPPTRRIAYWCWHLPRQRRSRRLHHSPSCWGSAEPIECMELDVRNRPDASYPDANLLTFASGKDRVRWRAPLPSGLELKPGPRFQRSRYDPVRRSTERLRGSQTSLLSFAGFTSFTVVNTSPARVVVSRTWATSSPSLRVSTVTMVQWDVSAP